MVWIRVGFNADPDRLFTSLRIQIRIRIQGAEQMRIYADLDPGQTLKSEQMYFYMKNRFFQ